jgi:type IV/VI secretion system ImpK/VasF family protein
MSTTAAQGATEAPASAGETRGRLAAAAGPLLSLLIVLRRSRQLDAVSDLRGTVDRLFQEFRSRGRDDGFNLEEIDDACYALASAFDETVLTATWAGREEWQRNSLAKRYCNDEFVGLGFYDKLAQVRRAAPPKPDVIEVFYYCLVSGFQGKMVDDPKAHADTIDELSREIGTTAKALSLHGYPEGEGGALQPIRKYPWPAVLVLCIFLPLLVWLLSWSGLDRQAAGIARALGGQ